MKIGIHHTKESFSDFWIEYCNKNNIVWKPVNCYCNDIMEQLSDCDALMWHFSQNSRKDFLFDRQLIYAVGASGKKVFPDFYTAWHFDDKVGQKYLFEALQIPMVPSWIFYEKETALRWVNCTRFPKVLKLRGGAGSQNVHLVLTRNRAARFVKQAFGRGIPLYDALGSLKERYRLFCLRKTNFIDLIEGIGRFIIPPPYARMKGRQKGYIYFQEFISSNNHDIRVIVIGNKAFAIKRMVRSNDFRASGSGNILYDKNLFDEKIIKLSFDLKEKLKTQCVAFDYIHEKDRPLIVEISYGFSPAGYVPCPGYWDSELTWHEGPFNPYGWMVEDLIKRVERGE